MDADTPAWSKPDLRAYLGQTVRVVIDRPLGSMHPRHPDIVYPVNYGFVPATVSGDGLPIDAYLLGVNEPVNEAEGEVIAVVIRENDLEDKLIVICSSDRPGTEQLWDAVAFQEQYFDSRIIVS